MFDAEGCTLGPVAVGALANEQSVVRCLRPHEPFPATARALVGWHTADADRKLSGWRENFVLPWIGLARNRDTDPARAEAAEEGRADHRKGLTP